MFIYERKGMKMDGNECKCLEMNEHFGKYTQMYGDVRKSMKIGRNRPKFSVI